jgi:hypothetical protein
MFPYYWDLFPKIKTPTGGTMIAARKPLTFAYAALLALLTGCASYTTPGAGVRIENLSQTDSDIAERFQITPAAPFPARVAVARVQAPGYFSRGASCYGTGRYCVVTTRDIESEASYEKLAKLPLTSGFALMSRILLPEQLKSTKDLRQAAAALKADMLLIYSMDTGFNIENTDIGPLALISLGFLPNKKARVTATASAAIFDVRTGFVYGVAESSSIEEQRATFWSSSEAVDDARKRAETVSFQKLTDEISKLWDDILRTHALAQRVVSGSDAGSAGR